MMQGQRDLVAVAQMLLSELAQLVDAKQAVIYVMADTERGPRLRQVAAYADSPSGDRPREYGLSEGIIGQCAQERRTLEISVPPGSIRVNSGLVDLTPRTVIVLPVLFEGEVKAVIELASLEEFTASHRAFLEQLTDFVGVVINNIEVTMRTERLLAQSQELAAEQRSQQRELQKTNEELAQKAQLLANQNAEVERKNEEIEQALRHDRPGKLRARRPQCCADRKLPRPGHRPGQQQVGQVRAGDEQHEPRQPDQQKRGRPVRTMEHGLLQRTHLEPAVAVVIRKTPGEIGRDRVKPSLRLRPSDSRMQPAHHLHLALAPRVLLKPQKTYRHVDGNGLGLINQIPV
jgi:hypothetical protein